MYIGSRKLVLQTIVIFAIFDYRYPVAIKVPKNNARMEVNEFLEEVKSMMKINAYHDNIVNLQGITFKTIRRMIEPVVEGIATIDVSYFTKQEFFESEKNRKPLIIISA